MAVDTDTNMIVRNHMAFVINAKTKPLKPQLYYWEESSHQRN
jgi:hypothetical protein